VSVRSPGGKGFRVDLQERASAYLAEEVSAKLNAFLLRPDILVREGRKPHVVADTKWKRLGAKEPNLGVASSDVYQVLAYARRYDLDQAVLVYPHDPALGAPGLKREFLTRSADAQKVRIRILTVDLARLAEIPGQLEEGLGRPPRGEAA